MRLGGGMALQNGVLVHGRTSWACAVRDTDGTLHVSSGRKPHFAPEARSRMPMLRGPIALAEAFALLPMVRRALPRARFPFERPAVLGSIAATTVAARALRRSSLPAGARELVAVGVAFVPALLSLRGPTSPHTTVPSTSRSVRTRTAALRRPRSTHGVDRSSLRRWSSRPSPRTSSHPEHPAGTRGVARVLGLVAAVGGSVELFSWVARNPENRAARALARPGFELQRRFSTAEPSEAQLEVANVARDACLALEQPPS